MNNILKIILSLSLSGSLLILILFFCKFFLKNTVSKRWQYYIWLVVIARLLLPFSPETTLIGNIFEKMDTTILSATPAPITSPNHFEPLEKDTALSNYNATDTQELQNHQTNSLTVSPIEEVLALFMENLWLPWLIIAAILFLHKITVYQNFVRYIKASQTPVSDIKLLDQMSVIEEQVRIKRAVELCVNPLLSSPLLIGFFRPCIMLPSIEISETEFRYIILHELTHYRRKDMFYKWLVQITISLHWFNPLVYVMEREINKADEFSCDEAVLSSLDSNEIQEYGKTLLHAMSMAGNYKTTASSITLSKNKKLLKERLDAIMRFKKKSKFLFVISTILTVVIVVCATFTGSYAMTKNILGSDKLITESAVTSSKTEQTSPSIVYESVSMNHYNGGNGLPFIHDIITNHTDKAITSIKHGMLAFDKNGKPLKIDWYNLDTDYDPTYYFLYDWNSEYILPNKIRDIPGGWTLNAMGFDPNAEKIEYVLYCIKSVRFKDGMVWKNPDFKSWLNTYKGKEVSTSVLKNYYPYVHTIKNLETAKQKKHTVNDSRVAFYISNNPNQINISESGSFTAYKNETLTLKITSTIKGGTADFFLFDPNGKSQDIRISGKNKTKKITLSAGRWAYNCSGFFKDGGDLRIEGTIQ